MEHTQIEKESDRALAFVRVEANSNSMGEFLLSPSTLSSFTACHQAASTAEWPSTAFSPSQAICCRPLALPVHSAFREAPQKSLRIKESASLLTWPDSHESICRFAEIAWFTRIISVSRTEPLLCEARFQALKLEKSQVWGDSRESLECYENSFFFLRINSRESIRAALQIASPSKLPCQWNYACPSPGHLWKADARCQSLMSESTSGPACTQTLPYAIFTGLCQKRASLDWQYAKIWLPYIQKKQKAGTNGASSAVSCKCYQTLPDLTDVRVIGNTNRPALSGGMDWWRMKWPFSRVPKIFFGGRIFQEKPWNSAERAIFAKFQAPKFENSEPQKLQFHPPSHSIPPLDSLLTKDSRLVCSLFWEDRLAVMKRESACTCCFLDVRQLGLCSTMQTSWCHLLSA